MSTFSQSLLLSVNEPQQLHKDVSFKRQGRTILSCTVIQYAPRVLVVKSTPLSLQKSLRRISVESKHVYSYKTNPALSSFSEVLRREVKKIKIKSIRLTFNTTSLSLYFCVNFYSLFFRQF